MHLWVTNDVCIACGMACHVFQIGVDYVRYMTLLQNSRVFRLVWPIFKVNLNL